MACCNNILKVGIHLAYALNKKRQIMVKGKAVIFVELFHSHIIIKSISMNKHVNPVSQQRLYIGVGRFRILGGGPKVRILGGGGGGGARGAKFPAGT